MHLQRKWWLQAFAGLLFLTLLPLHAVSDIEKLSSALQAITVDFYGCLKTIKRYYDPYWFERFGKPEALDSTNPLTLQPAVSFKFPATPAVSFAALKASADEFVQKSEQLRTARPHLNQDKKLAFIVRKEIVPVGTEIIAVADIHGDIVFLCTVVDDLIKKGYLKRNFTLAKPNCWFVFIGDYVDFGNYNTLVWDMLMKLYNANPERVVLIKGNHDLEEGDKALSVFDPTKAAKTKGEMLNFGFKALAFYFNEEIQRIFKTNEQKVVDLMKKVYAELPAALYIGDSNAYALMCHGGPEIGYNPKKLLADSRESLFDEWSFARLGAGRASEVKELGALLPVKLEYTNKKGKTLPLPAGFWWNVYQTDKKAQTAMDQYSPISIQLSKKLSDALFKQHAPLQYVIRGHQHVGFTEITKAFDRYGVSFTFGSAKTLISPSGTFNPNTVCTLAIGPDSFTGHEFRISVGTDPVSGESTRLDYDQSSYLIVTMNGAQPWGYRIVRIPLSASKALFGGANIH